MPPDSACARAVEEGIAEPDPEVFARDHGEPAAACALSLGKPRRPTALHWLWALPALLFRRLRG